MIKKIPTFKNRPGIRDRRSENKKNLQNHIDFLENLSWRTKIVRPSKEEKFILPDTIRTTLCSYIEDNIGEFKEHDLQGWPDATEVVFVLYINSSQNETHYVYSPENMFLFCFNNYSFSPGDFNPDFFEDDIFEYTGTYSIDPLLDLTWNSKIKTIIKYIKDLDKQIAIPKWNSKDI